MENFLGKGMKELSKKERETFAKAYGLDWIGRFVDAKGFVRARISGKYFHVNFADGKPAYETRFTLVGNFQEDGLAPVRDKNKKFFHIRVDGTPAYENRFDMFFEEGAFQDDGTAWAEVDGKMYDIDRQGKIIRMASF